MGKLKSRVSSALESLKSSALVNKPSPQTLISEVIFASPPLYRIDVRPLLRREARSPVFPDCTNFAGIGARVKEDDTGQESFL